MISQTASGKSIKFPDYNLIDNKWYLCNIRFVEAYGKLWLNAIQFLEEVSNNNGFAAVEGFTDINFSQPIKKA